MSGKEPSFKDSLTALVQKKYGQSAQITEYESELSRVRIRKGTTFDQSPGDRVRIAFEVRLNRTNRSAGVFADERDRRQVQKDDIVQINERGPEGFIGGLYQIKSVESTGVYAFCLLARSLAFFEMDQFELIGPAAMVTPEEEGHKTEPMDHDLNDAGEVVHATQVQPAVNGDTAPMGHAINEEAKGKGRNEGTPSRANEHGK